MTTRNKAIALAWVRALKETLAKERDLKKRREIEDMLKVWEAVAAEEVSA